MCDCIARAFELGMSRRGFFKSGTKLAGIASLPLLIGRPPRAEEVVKRDPAVSALKVAAKLFDTRGDRVAFKTKKRAIESFSKSKPSRFQNAESWKIDGMAESLSKCPHTMVHINGLTVPFEEQAKPQSENSSSQAHDGSARPQDPDATSLGIRKRRDVLAVSRTRRPSSISMIRSANGTTRGSCVTTNTARCRS